MIPTKHYKAVTTQTPLLNLLADGPYMDKAYIRTIHPQWKGESVPEIVEKYDHNPFVLRIGTPSTDASMINDRVFFISKYLAYNPTSKEIESRNLIEGRFIKKVYIGEQTVLMAVTGLMEQMVLTEPMERMALTEQTELASQQQVLQQAIS